MNLKTLIIKDNMAIKQNSVSYHPKFLNKKTGTHYIVLSLQMYCKCEYENPDLNHLIVCLSIQIWTTWLYVCQSILFSEFLGKFKWTMTRSSHRRYSKKSILKNFTKFRGKQTPVTESLYLNKETLAQLFSCKFCEILKNIFFIEHVRTTVSGWQPQKIYFLKQY